MQKISLAPSIMRMTLNMWTNFCRPNVRNFSIGFVKKHCMKWFEWIVFYFSIYSFDFPKAVVYENDRCQRWFLRLAQLKVPVERDLLCFVFDHKSDWNRFKLAKKVPYLFALAAFEQANKLWGPTNLRKFSDGICF